MDRLVVALVNSALEVPDPLETPLTAARWWTQYGDARSRAPRMVLRFDTALVQALRDLRDSVRRALNGQSVQLRFTGTGADAVLFPLAYAASRLLGEHSSRAKMCAAACGRVFVDTTKNGSRRWCSVRCMERARAPRRRTIAR